MDIYCLKVITSGGESIVGPFPINMMVTFEAFKEHLKYKWPDSDPKIVPAESIFPEGSSMRKMFDHAQKGDFESLLKEAMDSAPPGVDPTKTLKEALRLLKDRPGSERKIEILEKIIREKDHGP